MKSIALILFTLFLSFANLSYAEEMQSNNQKIYVQPNQVSISSNGIYVFLNNQWIPTEAVHTDAQGIYIDNVKYTTWTCPKCNFINNWWNSHCQKCGH